MGSSTRLRAVKKGEPVRASRKTVSEAAETGSHRELLVAMRDRIASAVANPNCPPRDLAALTLRLQSIAKEIEVLDAQAAKEAKEGAVSADEAWNPAAI